MRRASWWLLILICASLAQGCSAQPSAAPAAASTTASARGQGTPQARLPTVKLLIGSLELTAEIARTPHQIETGMMWRTNMAELEGMVFVFPEAGPRSFWMKNCPLPLSCAYIAADGTILELHDMKPFDESSIPSKSDRVQFVLEVNQGWFQRHGVKPGMPVSTELGSLKETFFQKR